MEVAARILAQDPNKGQDASESAPVDGSISRYRIAEKIGAGGMGEVYRAVRTDGQFTKEVAIKLVRGGFNTAFVLERFRNERQILAGLDHPTSPVSWMGYDRRHGVGQRHTHRPLLRHAPLAHH
jgi:eukaryotic-like serine/threonine-protein kinase